MAYPLTKACESACAEYSIYIYHRPENYLEGQSDWERRHTTFDFGVALREALRLTQTRNFRKVEIRQRITHPKTAHISDSTVRIFTPEKTRWWQKLPQMLF